MRVARVDDNQSEVVSAFRKLGWAVACTHTIGKGFPDLVISRGDYTALVEVKDGNKSPSKRRLTPDEELFHATWPGAIYIVESVEDVIRISNQIPH